MDRNRSFPGSFPIFVPCLVPSRVDFALRPFRLPPPEEKKDVCLLFFVIYRYYRYYRETEHLATRHHSHISAAYWTKRSFRFSLVRENDESIVRVVYVSPCVPTYVYVSKTVLFSISRSLLRPFATASNFLNLIFLSNY